jgi:hypothetical protein
VRAPKLDILGEAGNILDKPEFVDGTSKLQKRAFREAADTLRTSIEEHCGPLGADRLIAFWMGATFQAQLASQGNPVMELLGPILGGAEPGRGTSPETNLLICISYLARDLLSGGRVE